MIIYKIVASIDITMNHDLIFVVSWMKQNGPYDKD